MSLKNGFLAIALLSSLSLAACSNTIDCGPSATAASTSMSRCIGRQCMKTADGRARAISVAVTLYGASANRFCGSSG